MTGDRGRARGSVCVLARLALANLLTLTLAACGESGPERPTAGGHGPLVSPESEITACELSLYRGPETRLYDDRPYHTDAPVEAALGLAFCRGARHGTNVWTVEVSRPSTFVVFGHDSDGLDRRGWTLRPEPLHVAAAGVPLSRIYSREFPPGRYVVRQGYSRTAPVVFWDGDAVRIVR